MVLVSLKDCLSFNIAKWGLNTRVFLESIFVRLAIFAFHTDKIRIYLC